MCEIKIRDFLGRFLVPIWTGDQLAFAARIILALVVVERASYNALARVLRSSKIGDAAALSGVYRGVSDLPGGGEWSAAFISVLLKSSPARLVLATDWTSIGNFEMLVTALITRGRAVPLLYSPMGKFGSQVVVETSHFEALRNLLDRGREFIVLADRGFGHGRIIRTLNLLEFGFVLRAKSQGKITRPGLPETSTKIKQIPYNIGDLQDFGVVDFSARNTTRVRLIRSGSAGHKEPWLLLTNLTAPPKVIVRLYGCRFRIEGMFRDLKDTRYGLGVKGYQYKKEDSLVRIFTVATTAYIMFYLTGLHAKRRRWNLDYQSNSNPHELAIWRVGLLVLKDDERAHRITAEALLAQLGNVTMKTNHWDWAPRGEAVMEWTPPPKTTQTKVRNVLEKCRESERDCDLGLRSRIRELLKMSGMTQTDLATQIGRWPTGVNQALLGRRPFPGSSISPIATVFGMTSEQLLQGLEWTPAKRGRPRTRIAGTPKKPSRRQSERNCDRLMRDHLSSLLKVANMTQTTLAKRINCRSTLVSDVLGGRRPMPGWWLSTVSIALGITPEDLLGDTGWEPPKRGRRKKSEFTKLHHGSPAPRLSQGQL